MEKFLTGTKSRIFSYRWVQGHPCRGSLKPTLGFKFNQVIYPSPRERLLTIQPCELTFENAPGQMVASMAGSFFVTVNPTRERFTSWQRKRQRPLRKTRASSRNTSVPVAAPKAR